METSLTTNQSELVQKRVAEITSEFFWATDEVVASIRAVTSKPNHCVIVVWSEATNMTTTFGVDLGWDLKNGWAQYRQNGLGLIQKANGDLFAAATPAERIALIATETAEGLLSPEQDDRTKTILARFIAYAISEIEQRPFNAVFFEIKDCEIPMRVINFSS